MKPKHLLFAAGLCVSAVFAADEAKPAASAAHAHFSFTSGTHPMTVWYFVPPSAGPDAPVVFVLHGLRRDAENYLATWIPSAEQKGFVLVAPEFSEQEFPGDEGYIYGNTIDRAGRAVPREQWSFSAIEPIFDAVRERTHNRSSGYLLYGHSAGAQFVQRFLYFIPGVRVRRAVAANAGWYVMPDYDAAFPYGLKGTPITEADIRRALGVPMTILLGTADTLRKPPLRMTPEADAQGPHRLARGHTFVDRGRAAAERLKVPFHWSVMEAPGVGHSERGITPFAVRALFPAK